MQFMHCFSPFMHRKIGVNHMEEGKPITNGLYGPAAVLCPKCKVLTFWQTGPSAETSLVDLCEYVIDEGEIPVPCCGIQVKVPQSWMVMFK